MTDPSPVSPLTERQTFTKGPWIVAQDVYRSGDIDVFAGIVQYAGTHVAHVCSREEPDDGDFPRETALANARLIAAAPELLDALNLAVQIAESWIHNQLDGTSSLDGALDHLKPCYSAIAKAEGR